MTLMKTAQKYLEEANAIVPSMSVEDGIALHGSDDVVFVDVRDSSDIAASGTIAGALKIPRGLIEFKADPATPLHEPALDPSKQIVLVCGAGGMAALSGKVLKEMGFENVANVGGFGSWAEAGGPTE